MKKIIIIFSIFLAACGSTPVKEQSITIQSISSTTNTTTSKEQPTTKTFYFKDIPNVDQNFNFSAEIPTNWEVEYIPASQSINIYDPASPAEQTLEKSQIFIKYFKASQFLTLQTVTIHERTETAINTRPTVIYDIEKKAGVANFPSQPIWRNQRHIVTDIRETDDNPTIFYVFAKRPDLDQKTFDDFINSVTFNPTQLKYPIEDFETAINKKPFGIYITKETSPVQPERFAGYHTGVDIEIAETEDTPVYAIADGKIIIKKEADGYGGLLVITHTINKEKITAIYGHLRLSSIEKEVGDQVKAGEQIALLGEAFSNETDGERKHLHFALLPGESTDIRGYVQSETELKNWLDPEEFFNKNFP